MAGRPEGKYAWTAKIGDKGQLVIPKEARELFDISPGDTVLILGDVDQGLAILNNDAMVKFVGAVFDGQHKPEAASEE